MNASMNDDVRTTGSFVSNFLSERNGKVKDGLQWLKVSDGNVV